MKKSLLILMMFLLPLQSVIAMERNFTHVMNASGKQGLQAETKHIVEHTANIPHHHDEDDGDVHVDNSQKSFQHLSAYEHGLGLHVLLPAPMQLPLALEMRSPPLISPDTFSNRTTLPLLRPPRLPA